MGCGKTIAVVVLLFALALGSSGPVKFSPKKLMTFSQLVDHFNPLSAETYSQRYYLWDSSSLPPTAPVFLFIGGEAPVEFFEFQEVSAIQWAADLGARYIALEHRFYGHSNPTGNLSTSNLRFLSSQQALADVANFIETMKAKYSGPWIVLGCSYSGALSAWFRSKYPSLAIASVAPSGPVFAVANFTQFNNNFQNVASPSCVNAVVQGSEAMYSMTSSSAGLKQLSLLFNACKPIQSEDVTFFLWAVNDWMATNAQWENPPGWQLTQACRNLTAASAGETLSPSTIVANWGKSFASQSSACTTFTVDAYAEQFMDVTLGNDNRVWLFQQCTEFGFFDGANYDGTSVFEGIVPIEFLEQFCKLAFGQDLLPNLAFTNGYYGGYNVSGSQIYFTNGFFDPWHTLSVTSVGANSGQYSSVYQAAHCAPMTKPVPGQDPPSLIQTRANVKQFLQNALNDYYSKHK